MANIKKSHTIGLASEGGDGTSPLCEIKTKNVSPKKEGIRSIEAFFIVNLKKFLIKFRL